MLVLSIAANKENTTAEWHGRGLSPNCGDGILDTALGEQCDDGNMVGGDGCDAACVVEWGYSCSTHSPSQCSPGCGDGVLNGYEECDDHNHGDHDGCSIDCKVESGWTCSGTPSTCHIPPCGNGVVDHGEQCDDGNTVNGDGCDFNCNLEGGAFDCSGGSPTTPTKCIPHGCGNGIRDHIESCDDGNTEDGDGCSHQCQTEIGWLCFMNGSRDSCMANCGDGIIAGCEECDDGNQSSGDGCNSSCDLETGFTCSNTSPTSPSVCNAVCGDGIRAHTEQCDNAMPGGGMGCDHNCNIEPGYVCDLNVSPNHCYQCGSGYTHNAAENRCDPICGDGQRVPEEECDDGNPTNEDGCNVMCEIETWVCSGHHPDHCHICAPGTTANMNKDYCEPR